MLSKSMLHLPNDMPFVIDMPCFVSHVEARHFRVDIRVTSRYYVPLLYKVELVHMGHVWKTNVLPT